MTAHRRLVLVWGLAGLAALAVAAVLHLWVPDGGPESSICMMRRNLGLPCPGCGMTRAFAALAKADWGAAWQLHPFAYLLAVELAALWLVVGWWILRRGELPWRRAVTVATRSRLTAFIVVQAAAYLAFWTGRVATGTLPW